VGTGMSTSIYSLLGGDGDGTKAWYLLDLDMGMLMNFSDGDGYGIAKPVLGAPRCHPSYVWVYSCFILFFYFLQKYFVVYKLSLVVCSCANVTSQDSVNCHYLNLIQSLYMSFLFNCVSILVFKWSKVVSKLRLNLLFV